MKDLVIVGGGPAGVAAGIYAARKQLDTVFITDDWGGQSIVSPDIQNWIGTPHISGQDLAKNLRVHLEEYAGEYVDIASFVRATKIEKIEGGFKVDIDNGDSYEAKTLLLTLGSKRRKLPVQGADEFEHKGLTYCATCDGPLFSGKDVAVVGGGNAGFETAAQLLAYAKSVTLLDRGPQFRADPVTVKNVTAHENMTAEHFADIQEILGDKFVSGLRYKNSETGEEKTLAVQGIFAEIGMIPNTEIVTGLIELDKYNRIIADTCTQTTSTEGVWAAGDCTNMLYHQNNIAVGDAIKAIENIYEYLRVKGR